MDLDSITFQWKSLENIQLKVNFWFNLNIPEIIWT